MRDDLTGLKAPARPDQGAVRHAGKPLSSGFPVVVAGGGPVGIRAAQDLCRRGIDCVVINAERWQPYNRVKLTPLLAGDAQLGQILQPRVFRGPGKVDLFSSQSVIDIDRVAKIVTTSTGRKFNYSTLILALGSRAHVPPIPGRELSGTFTFRSADDVERLIARSFRSRVAVVIGGGLLGLEAARGMAQRGARTIVVEHSPHLMPRQLDAEAGHLLAELVAARGVEARTSSSVARITGTQRVDGIEFRDGGRIDCDTVIICTGIRSNMELARDVGLPVGRGIKVDETFATTDPAIYAVGECAEVNGETVGLVGPGFEQAIVAVSNIAGEPRTYRMQAPSTKLKLVGIDVVSLGDVEQLAQRSDLSVLSWRSAENQTYRAIVMRGWRLVGAIGVGSWPDINRAQQAIDVRALMMPWQLMRFWCTGRLFGDIEDEDVWAWPPTATVCNCTGVTRGQIGETIALGAASPEDIQSETGASTVCGSCRVHIETLLGGTPTRKPIRWWRPLAGLAAIAALLVILTIALPKWPLAATISAVGLPERLWLDGWTKQVSGYILLALTILATILSLRRRMLPRAIERRSGDYATWRLVHGILGAAALVALFAHTGFRLGHNLNFWLMSAFLAVLTSGAAIGFATSLEHRIGERTAVAARVKDRMLWLHVLALWPLPLLLAFHILSFYFY